MADKLKAKATPVRAYPHRSDSRANIPTAELESFARPEEKRPATVRYPRDPTLDPQLVWKGKDEQDGHDLEIPAVPIYIQETIDPLALPPTHRLNTVSAWPLKELPHRRRIWRERERELATRQRVVVAPVLELLSDRAADE